MLVDLLLVVIVYLEGVSWEVFWLTIGQALSERDIFI